MTREMESQVNPETVPLQHAVLCLDCELVTTSQSDLCPVCGGHALLGLAPMIGGTLIDYRAAHSTQQHLFLFDLHINIELSQMEADELSSVIESIGKIVAPKLARNRATVHVNVEPISSGTVVQMKAA